MVTAEENVLLTRTGPGTPMGNLIREYWIPALVSDELPHPDCPPIRLRLLCENLVAFRATSGKVGILEAYCPHRRTELFLGRNEEEGLRCVFHGWKWDITGACVDMPSEPTETGFTTKVRAKAYPCIERGGVVWTYMGSRSTPPPLPDIEANMLPGSREAWVRAAMIDCNWLQILENGLDTVHTAFLHNGSVTPETVEAFAREARLPNSESLKYLVANRAIRMVSEDTEFGCHYAAYRPAEEDTYHWQIAAFLFPFYHIGPTNKVGTGARFIVHVPIDDTHTMNWTLFLHPNSKNRPISDCLPNTSDYLGRFRSSVLKENDYNLDRELQRTDKTVLGFSGIPKFNEQDRAVVELMGDIADRTDEHLGGIDQMIIRTRRRMLSVIKDYRDHGVVPPGVDNPAVYRVRCGWTVLPRDVDIWKATEELRHTVDIDDNDEQFVASVERSKEPSLPV